MSGSNRVGESCRSVAGGPVGDERASVSMSNSTVIPPHNALLLYIIIVNSNKT